MAILVYLWLLVTRFYFSVPFSSSLEESYYFVDRDYHTGPSDNFSAKQAINVDSIVRSIDAGKSFRHVVRSAEGFSAEGTELTGTYDRNKQLRKLKTIHFGEMGKVSREYYLYKDALIYQKTITYTYDKPFYVEGYKVSVKRTRQNCIDSPAICNDADFRAERDAFLLDDEVYTFVEKKPEFPGGEIALHKFMREEVIITKHDLEEEIQGTFHIEFIVTRDGQVISPLINKKKPGSLTKLENAVLQMVYKMPRWKPGEQSGMKVAAKIFFPLHISFQE